MSVNNLSAYPLQLGNGSVGAPSLNLGDATTGLYRSAADEIGITVAGTARHSFAAAMTTFNGILRTQNSSASSRVDIVTFRDSTTGSSMQFLCARGTISAPASLQSGDLCGGLNFSSWRTGTTYGIPALIRCVANQAHSNSAQGGRLEFYTCPDSSTSVALRLTIQADGGVKIAQGLGIFDATPPTSKPSAGNLAELLTALESYGLITDTSI